MKAITHFITVLKKYMYIDLCWEVIAEEKQI